MLRRSLSRPATLMAVAVIAAGASIPLFMPRPLSAAGKVTGGTLVSPAGICPLKHTDVKAEVTGPLARVTVTQEFENPFSEKIEAVYAFPLPPNSAVDNMTMLVGNRTIHGVIKRREEARHIYETARRLGKIAGLLDQERPNIFTQAVANIIPRAKVKIVISYVETMPYEAGQYEFRFPMVVAPRYIPGTPKGKQGGGWSPDTRTVPDASRITPQVTPEGTRAGHDISIAVAVDAGIPIETIHCSTHEVAVDRPAPARALVKLRDQGVIPNKDFVLRYQVAGRGIQDAVLTHYGSNGGYFTLILQPPERVAVAEITPKELVFVLDTSGSMSGFPIEKAKETMRLALAGLNPRDTFNFITFAGDTHILFPNPVPATPGNMEQAQRFLNSRYGSGGTEMMQAIRASLEPSGDQRHVRVVCFMTDGEVGNDFDIIGEVKRHPNARVFAFGIGSSVNHFLLDNMARFGRGEVEYVGLNDDGSAAARRFHERVRNPLLTDISIDWGGLPVSDVYPDKVQDLFGAKPVILSGRYTRAASGMIRLRGKMAGQPFARDIRVNLPASQSQASQSQNDVLATLWARRRVDFLSSQDFEGIQRGDISPVLKNQITQLGLDYRLMTQFTSFVAVEETVVTEGGQPKRVDVPVEMPEGMSYDGIFGGENLAAVAQRRTFVTGVVGGVPMGNRRAQWTVMQESSPVPLPVGPANDDRKMHPAISQLIRRIESGGRPNVSEVKYVFGDAAHVRITVSSLAASDLERLGKSGFELSRRTGNVLVGRVAVDKLKQLVGLAFVVFIEPV